jgi:hypothetical protein
MKKTDPKTQPPEEMETPADDVEEASMESFPASDPPSSHRSEEAEPEIKSGPRPEKSPPAKRAET